MKRLLLASCLVFLLNGCSEPAESGDAQGLSGCQQATAHLESCFGASAVVTDCDAISSQIVLSQTCDGLFAGIIDTKADTAGVDAATKNAIRGVILAALELGITQAIDASLGALLLGDLDGIELYVSFFSTADADEAAAKALEIADILEGDLAYDPIPHAFDGSHEVLHGPCPVGLAGLAATLADITLTYPDLLKAMGGSYDRVVEGDNVTLSFHVPFAVVPSGEELESAMGCGE